MGSRALNSVPYFCKAITLFPSPGHRENRELSPASLCFQAAGCFTTELQVFPRLHPQPQRAMAPADEVTVGVQEGLHLDTCHVHHGSFQKESWIFF